MKPSHLALGAIVFACFALCEPALAQATQQDLQRALDDARAAAARAQAAAAAAEAALQKVQASQAAPAPATVVSATVPQSTFSISGNLDIGPRVTRHSDSAKNKTELSFNNSSTSLIWFKGSRQLGQDLVGSFLLELDFNPTQSSTANGAAGSNAFQGTPFTGEQYLALTGRWGDFRMGSPNAGALIAGVTAQPFGTGLSGGYVSTFGRLGTTGVSGINEFSGALAGRIIRHEKTLMYTTPSVSGFKASAEYAFGNDRAASASLNSNRYLGLTSYYNNGPINAVYAYAQERAGALGAAGPTAAIGTVSPVVLPPNTEVTWHLLGANYTFGKTTLYGGYTRTRHESPTPLENSHSWNIAVRQWVTPKFALLGNYVVRNSEIATNPDGRMMGLGLNYLIDDSTTLYSRLEFHRYGATPAVGNQKQSVYAVGARYQF